MKQIIEWIVEKWYDVQDKFRRLVYRIYDLDLKEYKYKHKNYAKIEDDSEFIWGILSPDQNEYSQPNIYSDNMFEIIYSRNLKQYYIAIKTDCNFPSAAIKALYLNKLLDKFKQFMIDNGYDLNYEFDFSSAPTVMCMAESIPELYTQFKIFVEGYKVYTYIKD